MKMSNGRKWNLNPYRFCWILLVGSNARSVFVYSEKNTQCVAFHIPLTFRKHSFTDMNSLEHECFVVSDCDPSLSSTQAA